MAEAKRKSRKAGEANLVTVDANRLREALKHTFEGVTMLFDCIGLNVPVGEPIPEQEEKPAESSSAEYTGTTVARSRSSGAASHD